MGIGDKFEEGIGKAKEAVGDAVGNEDLRQEGQAERIGANLKEMAGEVKEKASDLAGRAADKVEEIKDKVTGE